jgi:hypothetical protein
MIGGTFTARRSTSLLAVGCKKEKCNNYIQWKQFTNKGTKKNNLRSNVTVTNISKVPRYSNRILKLPQPKKPYTHSDGN